MLSDWWNGVELWVLGLAFPFQFALVIVVLAPLCLVVAWLIDRIVDNTSAWFGPSKIEEPPLGADPPADEVTESDEVIDIADHAVEEQPPATHARVPAESTGR